MADFVTIEGTTIPVVGSVYAGCVIFPNEPVKSMDVRFREESQVTVGTTRTKPTPPEKVY